MSVTLPTLTAAIAALALSGPADRPTQAPGPAAAPNGPLLVGGDAVGTPPVFVPYGYGAPAGRKAAPQQMSVASTTQIVASLQQATQYCGWLKRDGRGEFVIDCLSERLDDVSRRMAGMRGYEDVRAVLDQTSRDLNRIARGNKAAGQAPTRFQTQDPDGRVTRTNRRLVPVDSQRQAAAVAQALAVMQEAETRLLRSSQSETARAAQFQRIAAAVGSNKVLLRSL